MELSGVASELLVPMENQPGYGAATVQAAIADIHDQSERQMRAAIREISDGEYFGEDDIIRLSDDYGRTDA